MIELSQRLANLSPAQRQLLEQRLKKKPGVAEPIAIVGMSCRFAGAPNLDAFWRLIRDGICGTGEIPGWRWDVEGLYDPTGEEAGKMSVKWAGMVDDVDKFDPMFFGISPREAARMDPQQRLLLEVSWEALEHAGMSSDRFGGTATGVYVGIGGTDYSKIPCRFEDYYHYIDAHVGTGNALSIAANRVSYVLDLRGPSIAVDTACSSGMVGIHLAVQSLRNRECEAALAGGVNLILTPETTIAFSKAQMLSRDGLCRPFDAAANG
jgi:myxalamid-type polyketide synthase MxaB